MRLTQRRLNRATLARQLLLERRPLPVVDAVRRLVALQAQEPASPYVALWNRLEGFDPADLGATRSRSRAPYPARRGRLRDVRPAEPKAASKARGSLTAPAAPRA